MIDVLGDILAGLALFFIGVGFIGQHLKQMVGRRLRVVFSKLTGRASLNVVWGVVMGAMTQSGTANTFLCVNLVTSGLARLRQAVMLLNWSNVGISTLVLFATLDLKNAIYYMVGFFGLLFAFEKPKDFRHPVGVALGVGLLFFGIDLIQHGATVMRGFDWFREMLAGVQGQYMLGFLVGLLLSMLTQSSSAVAVVSVILCQAQLLGMAETLMVIYGANLGDSVISWILSASLKGTSKQVAMFQTAFNFVGAAIFIPLFYVEILWRVPLVLAFLGSLGVDLDKQGAVAFLVFNVVVAALLHVTLNPLLGLLVRRYPPEPQEDASRPKYLTSLVPMEPALALELAEREASDLAQRLPGYLELRGGTQYVREQADVRLEAFNAVAAEVRTCLRDIMNNPLEGEAATRYTALLERMEILDGLNRLFAHVAPDATVWRARSDSFGGRLVEGLEAATLTVMDAVKSGAMEDLVLAAAITSEGSETVSRLRDNYLLQERSMSFQERAESLQLFAHFERVVFLLNALVRNLKTVQGTWIPAVETQAQRV